MLINQPPQMVPWDLIFQPEIVKQRFRAGVLAHHEPESSDNGDAQQHGQTMLLNTSHCHTDLTQISLIRTHFFNTHASYRQPRIEAFSLGQSLAFRRIRISELPPQVPLERPPPLVSPGVEAVHP